MKTELQERADSLASNLQRSVDACFEVLRSISQLFASSEQVGREDFHRFVQPALARHPSIQALEWLPRLLNSDRSTFEQAIQAEGYFGFQVTERTPDGKIVQAEQRTEYFPVCYVEPMNSNELALGFDLASDLTRRSALEKARDIGAIALSGRIELVQEAQKQFGFLVILPIYRHRTAAETPSARRKHLQGFVLGVFRVADIVRTSLSGVSLDNIDFYLHDKSEHPKAGFLAGYESGTKQILAELDLEKTLKQPRRKSSVRQGDLLHRNKTICTRSFNIANRQWAVLLLPTPAYIDRAELYQQSRIRADLATVEAEKLKQALRNLQQTQARWFLEKNLIAVGVGLVLLTLGGANLVSYGSMNKLLESKDGIERVYTVLASLAKVLAVTTDAETAIFSAKSVQGSDKAELQGVEPEVETLRQAIASNPNQQRRLTQLEPLVVQRMDLLHQQSVEQQNRGISPPPSQRDQQIQQQIRQTVAEMEREERSRLPHWESQAEKSIRTTFLMNVGGICLSFALLVGVYYLLQRQITERQQIESALFEANNQLELEVQERLAELAQTREISDLKLRLFSMVSHEFRTPLSTILVSTQLLNNSEQSWSEEKRAKNLTRIQSAAKTMAQLLSDILTLNRAEVGKLEFRPELLDLESFCHHLVEEIQISTETEQPIHFISHGQPSEICLDSKLLHSMLANLLSNAVKYSSPDSPIQFTLIYEPEAVTFQVQDQGIGISPEDQQRLYETFHRGQNVGDVVGSGLGLAVVKTCVDLHGGDVMVESEIGVGTTFTVILPR